MLVNAYFMVQSEDVGNFEEVNNTVRMELQPRDQGYRLVEWAFLYHTYRIGAVWFDQDEERFNQVLNWCKKKQLEHKELMESAKPFLASYFLGDKSKSLTELGIPDESMEDLLRLYVNQESPGQLSPTSCFFDLEGHESVIPNLESFAEFALVPITINMWDSWTYTNQLGPILQRVDTQFPLKTLGISDPISMI